MQVAGFDFAPFAETAVLLYGAAFVARRADGAVLIGTRPEKGLLGGMVEVPNSAWTVEPVDALEPPLQAEWRHCGSVDHVFTHFPLRLTVYVAELPRGTRAPKGARWAKVSGLTGEALPTVMRKVLSAALD